MKPFQYFPSKGMPREPTACDRTPSKEVLDAGTDVHNHHEYFHYLGDGVWEWWEKLSVGVTDDFIMERTKTFTEATFVQEVLQPMVDHVGECTCAQIIFHPLNEGEVLPEWLSWQPERAEAPLPRIVTDDAELNEILYGSLCYGKDESCCYGRTASRPKKIQLWVTVATNLKKERDALAERLKVLTGEEFTIEEAFQPRRQQEYLEMVCFDAEEMCRVNYKEGEQPVSFK